MGQEARATQLIRDTAPVIHAGSLTDKVRQMFDSVAQRAFAIFQSNGGSLGRDLEDWFQAERELFHPAHLDGPKCLVLLPKMSKSISRGGD